MKELEGIGDLPSVGNYFYFTLLTKPIEPCHLWLELCWYTLHSDKPISGYRPWKRVKPNSSYRFTLTSFCAEPRDTRGATVDTHLSGKGAGTGGETRD